MTDRAWSRLAALLLALAALSAAAVLAFGMTDRQAHDACRSTGGRVVGSTTGPNWTCSR